MQEALYSRFDLYPVTEQVKEMRLSWGGGNNDKSKTRYFCIFSKLPEEESGKGLAKAWCGCGTWEVLFVITK